ncbi:MAG: hypothetical protein C0494_16905 [Sphingobium sp.]|nr:hypothetical protein [Sphingobium sp.]
MAQPKVAIRLGTEGKQDVVNDFKAVGDAGDAAANRASRAFDKAATDFEAAERRMASASQKIAAIMPKSALQMQIESVSGSTATGGAIERRPSASSISSLQEGSAKVSAAAFRELYAEQERLTAGAAALRAQLDPVWAAQQRFNAEMAEARTLIAGGAITLDEYCDKLRLEKTALDQVSQSHGRTTISAGAMRAGMQNLGFQAQDFIVQIVGGTDAMRAFAMQAPQAIGALQQMSNSAEGGNTRFAAMANILSGPVGIALGVAIPLAVLLGEKLLSGASAADSMSARQGVLASMIDQTTGRLKEQNQALLQNQVLLAKKDAANAQSDFDATRQSLRILRPGDIDLARISRFAADTGQTSRAAQMLADLAKEKPWLAGQAESMTRMLGDMTQQARLVVQAQAQTRLLSGGGRPGDAKRAFGDFSSGSAASIDMGTINARAKLAAASDAVGKAEARLTLARSEAEAQLKAGTITEAQATAQIATAERTLDQARDAQSALTRSRSEARRLARAAEREDEREKEEAARKVLALEKQRNAWANEQAANAGKASGAWLTAEGDKVGDRNRDYQRQLDDMSGGTALLNLEWELRGRNRDEAQRILEVERYRLDIMRQYPTLTADQVAELVKAKEKQVEMNDLVASMRDYTMDWAEIGKDAVSRIFDITSAQSWGDRVMSILVEIANEMIRMQAIQLFMGSKQGGGGGLFGTLLGGIVSAVGGGGLGGVSASSQSYLDGISAQLSMPRLLGSAIGNEYTPAGAMLVGENGPEVVDMPRGAKVMTASDTRRAMAGSQRAITYAPVYQIDATGADPASLMRVEAKLDEMDRSFSSRTLNTVQEASDRLYLRFGG